MVEQKKQYPIMEGNKCVIVVLLNSKNAAKVAKIAKHFNIPMAMLATVLKKDNIISHFFLIRTYAKTR